MDGKKSIKEHMCNAIISRHLTHRDDVVRYLNIFYLSHHAIHSYLLFNTKIKSQTTMFYANIYIQPTYHHLE